VNKMDSFEDKSLGEIIASVEDKVITTTVTINYKAGHTRSVAYYKSHKYCPNCGKQSVWVESGEGDYYAGSKNVCTICSCHFSLQRLDMYEDSESIQVVDQLTEADMG
jgi:hypothetical protein